ncbi:hypothetical protein BH20ACT5_BH20ACT5_20420 [soil metagenome]
MASWTQFEAEAPELAARAWRCLDAHGHKTVATLRRDGSPRICGTELATYDGWLWLAGALRFADLRRDPRFALHSGSDDPAVWREHPESTADAKLAGTAHEVTDPDELAAFAAAGSAESPHDEAVTPGSFEAFRLDLTEAVVVRVGDGHLLVESWHEGRGRSRAER